MTNSAVFVLHLTRHFAESTCASGDLSCVYVFHVGAISSIERAHPGLTEKHHCNITSASCVLFVALGR